MRQSLFRVLRGWVTAMAFMYSVLAFPAAPAVAEPTGWESPTLLATLAATDTWPVPPQIAMNPEGFALAIWSQTEGNMSSIWAAHFVSGRWSSPRRIGTGDPFGGLDVAVDPTGAAVAVWDVFLRPDNLVRTIYASRLVPGIGWDVPIQIGTGLAPQVEMDFAGNALAVWMEFVPSEPGGDYQARVWGNRFVPGTGWGTPTLIESERGGLADLAVDASGNAVAGWWCEDNCGGTTGHLPMVSLYTPVSGWEAPTPLEGHSHPVKVAFDSDGTALALWGLGPPPLRFSRHVPGTSWDAPAQLVGPEDVTTWPYELAAGEEGVATAAWSFGTVTQPNWSEHDPYYHREIRASRFAPGIGWQAPTVLSKETGAIVARDVRSLAMDPRGDSVIVWTEHDGARTSVWASHYLRGRGWGSAEPISEVRPADDTWANFYWQMSAEVAMDREGRATAVWSQSSGNRTDVWVNRFIPPPPWERAWEGDVMSLEAKVLILAAANGVLAAALCVLFVSYRTLRKRTRPQKDAISEAVHADPRDPSHGTGNRGTAARRGNTSSLPGHRRWPANHSALRLTSKERVLLHLLDFAKYSDASEFPSELTSNGIAHAIGIDPRHVAQYLRPLVKEGLVREKTARVRGVVQRRKVYVLDAEGWRFATGVRERILFLTVRLRDDSGEREATVAHILAATHGNRNVLDVAREAIETGLVDLRSKSGSVR